MHIKCDESVYFRLNCINEKFEFDFTCAIL